MTCCQVIVKKCRQIWNKKIGDVLELVPNLGNKTEHKVHYRNLQLYLSLGMKLKKIHRVLKA